ncbi:hypothetical protein [Pedobacter metabolipauper]|uniref:Uncharacterized protein n=1 Tax=Pedobacter metabolipauper TaxID=425513 RepID=A0A4R6SWH4_9SPHI|nr:hypothetical protein [Pedobacter metabolipauper]TDQ09473.1 hypothetical protein ATK78_1628 [Pedobacter metabolipauper]
MKWFLKMMCPVVALILLQSCEKEVANNEEIIDHFTYGAKFNWREDAIKTGNGDWKKITNGHVFSWLAQGSSLQRSNFAVYSNRANINADFLYTIQKDSVFALILVSDTVYFLNADHNRRTDLEGNLTFSPDSSLILKNTAISPAISVKYKLEK